jgi:molybdopterin converting factor small subunit
MVRVEFFGVPRTRAGVGKFDVGDLATVGDALNVLAERLPMLREDCLQPRADGGWELSAYCLANIAGRQFVRDPGTRLENNDVLLILSADAGG